jgi:hypothetical protein
VLSIRRIVPIATAFVRALDEVGLVGCQYFPGDFGHTDRILRCRSHRP